MGEGLLWLNGTRMDEWRWGDGWWRREEGNGGRWRIGNGEVEREETRTADLEG